MDELRTRITSDRYVLGYWRVTLDHPPVNTIDDQMYEWSSTWWKPSRRTPH
jgi:hypothetical protein